jgi:serine/threonine-protein kinase
MAILPGRRLGPYEILSAIGAGGMGEVYKARDTRLDRIVAIKVLPAHLADRTELRERFEREAKTVASLNHPHICTLFDIGQQDGIDYLVMEYLEGETLAQRLQKGTLPLEQVLTFAIEISDALDKAHRKSVTHRDLKPGNVMVTKSGTKLLDFGLAKLKQEAAPENGSLSNLSTAADPLTAQGTIVGTLQYMAPEQVEGREVDARTDIFAFGAVVYEMATGKRAFDGKTQASVIGAIMSSDPPPISSLQPMTPPALDRVVRKCLAKEPDDRWHVAKDLCDELKWITGGSSQAVPMPLAQVKGMRAFGRRELILSSGASLLGAVVAGIAVWNLKPSPSAQPVSRTAITLPPGQQLAGLDRGPAVALSPDGTRLAYVAHQGGTQQIYLRAMDSLEAKPILGTDGAFNPFFSPDGQWLGFFSGGKLKKASMSGGTVLNVGDVAFANGASWGSQGKIAFAPTNVSAIEQMPDAGGTATLISHFVKAENSHRWPEFMPDGKSVLFTTGFTAGNWENVGIAVQLPGTGGRRNLIPGTAPRFASSGHLIYAQQGSLMAAPFDSQRLEVTGAAVPMVEGVLQSASNGYAQYSLSNTGSLVYVLGGLQSNQSKLVWVNRNGAEQPLSTPGHNYVYPRLSPDGRRVAIAIAEEQGAQVWLYNLEETLTRLTFEGLANNVPAWTPDGKRIAFLSSKEEPPSIFWQLADGSGGLERLTTTNQFLDAPLSFTPDGQLLAFIESDPSTGYDIWVMRMSDRKVQPFIRTPFNESAPQFSPDGHWMAYVSNESGPNEIYVQAYPGPGGKWQISTEGGTEPVWSRNGRELFYRNGNKMMAVDVATQPSFTGGKPRLLFEGPYVPTPATFPNYDVSSDGQRFLMLKPSESAEAAPTQINVVLNWFEELKRRVPVGK